MRVLTVVFRLAAFVIGVCATEIRSTNGWEAKLSETFHMPAATWLVCRELLEAALPWNTRLLRRLKASAQKFATLL